MRFYYPDRVSKSFPICFTHVTILLLLLLSPFGSLFAQTNSNANSGSQPSPTQVPISLSTVISDADQTMARIREIRSSIEGLSLSASILNGTESTAVEIAELHDRRVELRPESLTLEMIAASERDWARIRNRLDDWSSTIANRVKEIDGKIADLKQFRERWSAADALLSGGEAVANRSANTSNAISNIATGTNTASTALVDDSEVVPAEITVRATEVLTAIAATERLAGEKRAEFLSVASRVSEQSVSVAEELSSLKQLREQELENIFAQDDKPVWEIDWVAAASGGWADFSKALSDQFRDLSNYASKSAGRFALHGIVLVGLLLLMFWVRKKITPMVADEPKLERAASFFRMPIAAALLLSFFFVGAFYVQAPRLLTIVTGLAAIIPGVLILREIVERPLNYLLYGLLGLYIVDRLRDVLNDLTLADRAILIFELLAACLFLFWFYRSKMVEQNVEAGSFSIFNFVRKAIPFVIGIFAIALLANVTGFVSLSNLIGNGILRSAYSALLLYTLVQIIRSSVAFALRVRPLNYLSAVRNNRLYIRQRVTRGVAWLVGTLWIYLVLSFFSVQDIVLGALSDFVGFSFKVGELSIGVGDVLLFCLMIWIAILVSRFIRFILEEDVFPRIDLAGGVSFAISSVLHYAIIVAGFLFAVSAAGIELSKFAVVLGALGLGVGLGLQTIVNNFVSGMILLFERPVKVGDTVEISGQIGKLSQIGLRASIVRKVDGSDVIVPNSQLISEEVVNWTGSDDRRRIDIPVGVAYGTNPQEVLTILKSLPTEFEQVLKEPAPRALFIGMGESSLDFELRIWTHDAEEWVPLRSDLVTAMYTALTDANIEIPFPQRDLNLRTVSKEAAAVVLGSVSDSERVNKKGKISE